MNRYLKKVKPKNKYRDFLRVLNGNLYLTDRELEVFSFLLEFDVGWEPRVKGEVKNIIATDFRRIIIKEMRIYKTNLSKYLKQLKEKGLIMETEEGGVVVSPMFIPEEKDGKIEVSFVLDFNEG